MKIYVASSWRNDIQPLVVKALRKAGHDVYDFKNPAPGNNGFHWSDIDPNWQNQSAEEFRQALKHPIAERGFRFDMKALRNSDACVLVLPCNRSAHLEAGYAIGAGKPTVILLENGEPELMYNMTPYICLSINEVIKVLWDIQYTYKFQSRIPMRELKEYANDMMTNPYFAATINKIERGDISMLEAISELSKIIKEREGAEVKRISQDQQTYKPISFWTSSFDEGDKPYD